MRSCNAGSILRPNRVMAPESGTVMLTIMRMVVVLPAPFGPSSPNTRPARTSRLSSLTAVNSPKLLLTRSSFTVVSLAAMLFSLRQRRRVSVFFCPKGAEYDSQGQVRSEAEHVSPGNKLKDVPALKGRDSISAFQASAPYTYCNQGRRASRLPLAVI